MSTSLWQTYAGKAVYVSSGSAFDDQTASGAIQQLSRIQSFSWDASYPLRDSIYTDGGLDAYMNTPPGIDVTLDWYATQGTNERFLGLGRFTPSGTLVIGLDEERNLYVGYQDALGQDAADANAGSPRTVLGLSQGLLTSYQLSASVGGIISSRATLNYLTAVFYTGASGMQTPTVNPQDGNQLTGRFVLPAASTQYNPDSTGYALDNVAAISARDMVIMFADNTPFGIVFTGQQACYLQSFQLGLTFPRQTLKPLGYAYPQDRPVLWPVRVDLNTEAIVSRYQGDQLRRLTCTVTGQSVGLAVKQPCSSLTTLGFYFDNLQIASQSVSATIGGMDRVTTSWRGWMQSPSDTLISPFWNTIIRLDTSGEWGGSW